MVVRDDWFNLNGAFSELIYSLTLFYFSYDVSPIEDQLVHTRVSERGTELCLTALSGDTRCIRRFYSGMVNGPRFSPNGKRLVYMVLRDGSIDKEKTGLYLYDLHAGQERQIYQGHAHNWLFTPDGRWIILECEDGVYLLSLTGRLLPTWARRIASYTISPRGELCVEVDEPPYYVITSWQALVEPAGKAEALLWMGRHPLRRIVESASGRIAWSPSGGRVAYVTQRNEHVVEIRVSYVGAATDVLLVRQVGSSIAHLRWSHRGDKLFFMTLTPFEGRWYEISVWCMDVGANHALKLPLFDEDKSGGR
jgi:hypothetical protein